VPERLRVRRRLDTHDAVAAAATGSSRIRMPLPPSEK
jgi:hypothetical protein